MSLKDIWPQQDDIKGFILFCMCVAFLGSVVAVCLTTYNVACLYSDNAPKEPVKIKVVQEK